MQFRRPNSSSVIEIFTSVDSPEKPRIIFHIPIHDQKDIVYWNKTGLLPLGYFKLTKSNQEKEKKMQLTLVITVTSVHKVMRAIDLFSTMILYKFSKNDKSFAALNQFKQACKVIQDKKGARRIPPKSSLISKYFKTGDNFKTENVTYHVIKEPRDKRKSKEYIYKENASGRALSEIEVFNGFCYRLLLGKRHPKVKNIIGAKGERLGLVSEVLPGFWAMENYASPFRKLTYKKLLDSEFVKVKVACYLEEEADLHNGNYGFDNTGFCVKIDDDRSTWPKTSKYQNVNPETGNRIYNTPPAIAFRITQRDIVSFPLLNDAKPFEWFDSQQNQEVFKDISMIKLMQEQKFKDDKFFMFLKRVLIPHEVYEAIGMATMGSYHLAAKLANHKINRTNELKKVLLDIPEFQQYMIKNPTIIEKIKAEFAEYNEDYEKEKDHDLRELEGDQK